MTEEEARAWVDARYPGHIGALLERFATMVAEENARQNLIAPSTVDTLWSRHIVDSLQLDALAPDTGTWLDIGTGGGFPGLAVAIARPEPTVLVEPRRRRAEFLSHVATTLSLGHVTVHADKVERISARARVISARAVATIGNLLRGAAHCATPETTWLLPRGAVDRAELDTSLRRSEWMFHVEQSLTSEASSIVVLTRR